MLYYEQLLGGIGLVIKRTLITGLALALATAVPALALAKGKAVHSTSSWEDENEGDNSFGIGTLNGTYVFEAKGFADDSKVGEVAVLGTLTFDGAGGVSDANLILTHGDTVQGSCGDAFDSTTNPPPIPAIYTFDNTGGNPGLYTLTLPLAGTGNTGFVSLGILVPSAEGHRARVIEKDTGSLSGVSICGTPISSMALTGSLKALDGNGGGD